MVCPRCNHTSTTSTVTEMGRKFLPKHGGPNIFYDTVGKKHNHNMASTQVNYRCSKGHTFTQISPNICTACNRAK